jgi:hypothetical protein
MWYHRIVRFEGRLEKAWLSPPEILSNVLSAATPGHLGFQNRRSARAAKTVLIERKGDCPNASPICREAYQICLKMIVEKKRRRRKKLY